MPGPRATAAVTLSVLITSSMFWSGTAASEAVAARAVAGSTAAVARAIPTAATRSASTVVSATPGARGSNIDPKDVAARVTALAAARAATLGVKSAKAECPRPFVARATTIVYQCTVPFEGQHVPYLVRLDAAGTPSIEALAAVIVTRSLASRVAGSLPTAQSGSKVDCGAAKLVVRVVGATVDCRVVTGAGRRSASSVVRVLVVDSNGSVEILPSSGGKASSGGTTQKAGSR